ncbi:MAG: hypothetical protein NVS2B16_03740 [Chloroflexota bacterium]
MSTLRLPGSRKRAIAREIKSHLDESRRDLLLAGWDWDTAEAESVRRLGDVAEIADGFRRVYRPTRMRTLTLALALAGAGVAGAYGASGGLASATMVRHSPAPARKARMLPHHYPVRPVALSVDGRSKYAAGGRRGDPARPFGK